MTCEIFEKLADKEVFHNPKMKESYGDLPESVQDKLSDEEYESYMVDAVAEKKFEEQLEKEKGQHLSVCKDEKCQTIKNNWLGVDYLKGYIGDKN